MPHIHRFESVQIVPRPLAEAFAFFADAANLEAITPPFLRFRILTPLPIAMSAGTLIDYSLSLFGIRFHWRTRITAWDPGVRFVDEQEKGPYALWRHTHTFEARGDSTIVRDQVEYALPFGPVGAVARALFVGGTVARIFAHRRQAIAALLPAPRPGLAVLRLAGSSATGSRDAAPARGDAGHAPSESRPALRHE